MKSRIDLVTDPLDHLTDRRQRDQIPLLRLYWVAEAIFNRQIQTRLHQNAMQEVLQLRPVDVEKLVRGDDLDVREEIGAIKGSVSNTRLYIAPGHADLVDQLAVGGDIRMIRFAAQNINCAALQVVIIGRITKKRPS